MVYKNISSEYTKTGISVELKVILILDWLSLVKDF